MKKINLLTLFLMLIGTGLFAQRSFFQAVQPGEVPQAREASKQVKNKGLFRLNEQAMRTYLRSARMEFKNNGITLPLEIPFPDGRTEIFNMVESPILSPAVAAQNPDIKTYTGNGTRDKKSVIRISFTANGFSAIILNVGGDAIYFEPYSKQQPGIYFNYFGKDAASPDNKALSGRCGVLDLPGGRKAGARVGGSSQLQRNSGGILRTFRIAVAANGEFTAQNGGTQASSFAKVVNYVNDLTAVYRNELSVSFMLVSGTNIIYTDAATDPYNNASQSAMLNQNQANLDAVIGTANYDIGHVWGTVGGSGGGLASLEAVCDATVKARGASGEGDGSYAQIFNDQLFFHEVGHQFGMTHSYNSSIPVCTSRNPATSVEPGSGATIMSYGFTCDDDDYFSSTTTGPILTFHTVNYDQAEAYIANPSPGFGNCFVGTATGNTPPVVTVPTNYTIPKSTPFALTGSATDANGDALTYSWEGTNIGTMVPNANTLANTAQPPFFRTYEPSTSPTRIYPLLSAILDGSNYAKGDKLPSVGIATTHRLTVRDNNSAGGGVQYGDVTVTVNGAIGPFLVTSNLSGSYAANSTRNVTWSVNGTSTATPNVKISLSTDGGLTFPIVLAASTPNDGTQMVTFPNNATTTARLKVESVGNIFFDISNADFTITAAPAVTYDITANAGNNGTITPNGVVRVTSGASQTFTFAPADACFAIATVLVDGVNDPAAVSSGTYTFTNVTANHTIRVTFSRLMYFIAASAGANGTITPASDSVRCGNDKKFTITPDACYQIATVLIDGVNDPVAVSTGTYTFTNVTAPHTISATFSQQTYTITSSAGANGSITPNGTTNVNCGANQTYTIAPNAGFNVQDVVVDGVSQGAITTYTFTNVVAAHTISASFVAIVINLTINDITFNEGNSSTSAFTFTVSLSSPAPVGGVTFNIATANNTAVAPADYTAKSLTAQTIPAGSSTYSFTVLVNGDVTLEPTESFFVNVTNATNAVITDAQGVGTITNDDAADPCATDATPPVITPKNNPTVFLNANGQVTVQPTDVATVTDNCTLQSVTVAPNSFSCANITASNTYQPFVASNSIGNQNAAGEQGMDFRVNATNGIVITQLGAFDHQANGLIGTQPDGNGGFGIRVAIFNKANQSIVSGLDVVITGNGDAFSGNYRYKNIPAVTLPPGDYVVLAKGYNANELSGNSYLGGGPYPQGDNAGGAITYLNTAYYDENDAVPGFTYPSVSVNTGTSSVLKSGTFTYALSQNNVVTVTAKDVAGNQSQVNVNVMVVDTMYVLATKNITVNLNSSGQASIQPRDVLQSYKNKCGIDVISSTLQVSPSNFTCADVGAATLSSPYQPFIAINATGNQNAAGEQGMDFRVNATSGIVITQLGAFDHQANGLIGTQPDGNGGFGIRVAIFNKANQSIVSGLDVVITGNGDAFSGNYRYKNIPAVTLPPGDYVVLAKGYNANELSGNSYLGGGPYPQGDNASGAITYLNTAYYDENDAVPGFTYPSVSVNTGTSSVLKSGTFTYKTKMATGTLVTLTATDVYGNQKQATANVTVTDFNHVCTPAAKAAPVMAAAISTKQPKELVEVEKVSAYPNPSNGVFNVLLSGYSVPKLSLEILDGNGKVVAVKAVTLSSKTQTQTVPFDLGNRASGMYWIRVVSATGVQTTKVVVNR